MTKTKLRQTLFGHNSNKNLFFLKSPLFLRIQMYLNFQKFVFIITFLPINIWVIKRHCFTI